MLFRSPPKPSTLASGSPSTGYDSLPTQDRPLRSNPAYPLRSRADGVSWFSGSGRQGAGEDAPLVLRRQSYSALMKLRSAATVAAMLCCASIARYSSGVFGGLISPERCSATAAITVSASSLIKDRMNTSGSCASMPCTASVAVGKSRRFDGAFGGLSQQCLELGEHLFDGVEIGRMPRKQQVVRR